MNTENKVTIFAVPKPFVGHIGVIQRNALGSWKAQGTHCRVILMGDESGTAETATEFGVEHIPHIARNESGTPLLNSIFDEARRASHSRILCFINFDIMLLANLVELISRIRFKTYLMVGRRYNINIKEPWKFDEKNWSTKLIHLVAQVGEIQPDCAIDYFIFTRDLFHVIPEFAIGRVGYDNWLIYKARSQHVPVIDASQVIIAAHQNHEYRHHPDGYQGTREGIEAKTNIDLCGGGQYRGFSIRDSTWVMSKKGIYRALSYNYLSRHFDSVPILYPKLKYLIAIVRVVLKPLIKWFRLLKQKTIRKQE